MIKQPIFKQAFVTELEHRVHELPEEMVRDSYYNSEDCDYSTGDTLPSGILVNDENRPILMPGVSDDFDNAIKVYEWLQLENETQASDRRLWAYLAHVEFRDYVQQRWKADDKPNIKKYVLEHWFHDRINSPRSLRRHAIARLWWAAHLTKSPHLMDTEYFDSLLHKDEVYYYTGILFSSQDVYQSLVERNLGLSRKILIAILEYIGMHPEFESKKQIQELTKQINLAMGIQRIDFLTLPQLLVAIDEASANIPDYKSIDPPEGLFNGM